MYFISAISAPSRHPVYAGCPHRRAASGARLCGSDAAAMVRRMTEPHPAPHTHETETPRGELALRISAMPADTNAAGDIFGGWIMGLMDMAAGSIAHVRARGRVATVAVSDLRFVRPVKVGNLVSCYVELVSVGRTSITLDVDVWARRATPECHERVTKARFVMVAVDANGTPRPVDPTS